MNNVTRHKSREADARFSPGSKIDAKTVIEYKPIGIVHSPFLSRSETPRQPQLAEGVAARVEIFPQYTEALEGIERFSHLILICHLHLIDEYVPKVTPRGSDETPRGVLATRAPVRPNPIGVSVTRLVNVEKNILIIEGVDFINGTPVLDIKPYYEVAGLEKETRKKE